MQQPPNKSGDPNSQGWQPPQQPIPPPPYAQPGQYQPMMPPPYAQPGQYQPMPPYLQPGQYQPMPPPPPKKKSRRGWIIASIVIGVLILSGIIANGSPKSATTDTTTTAVPTQQTQVTNTSKPTSTPHSQPTPTAVTYPHFSDGNFVVGKDIQPGTYRTRTASSGCYYARLSGFGGTLGEIITNANTDAPAIVTISASDKGFQSTGCGSWTKDLSAITTSKTSFGAGIFIVGTDMKSGTYKSSGQSGCYYARLGGFGGTLGEIIANNNTDTSAIVTISASDKGFESTRCGTWTRV